MKVIEGGFDRKANEAPEAEETLSIFIDAMQEYALDELMIIGRSSDSGALIMLSNQGVPDQLFLMEAGKQTMFGAMIVHTEED